VTDAPPVERAVAALRSGRPVAIDGGSRIAILAVETATSAMLELVDPQANADLLISGARAAALGLGNRLDAADPERPVRILRADWLDNGAARALVDAGRDMDRAPIGPLLTGGIDGEREAIAALTLARLAGLLPALWLVQASEKIAARVEAGLLIDAAPEAAIVARANLPLEGLPPTQIIGFRASDDGEEHVALMVGAPGGQPPLVRLHSECLTGDVFGSLKCDCGPQLKQALRLIGEAGGGVLLYLRQEGRGIGLANKLRAYQLQDRGLDTVDANRRLGFADDERDYAMAAAMLRALGVDKVRLLTNNPAKVEGLAGAGITVVERVAHHMPVNPHNADYLETKRSKSGHLP
jgi:GTP cyclohydrolase II